jgi:hypothetical protein
MTLNHLNHFRKPVSDQTGSGTGVRALPWLRGSVAGFSQTRLESNPRLVHVGFVMVQLALDGFYFEYFGFLLSVSFHQHPILCSFITDTTAASKKYTPVFLCVPFYLSCADT